MHGPACGLLRIFLSRTRVNKAREEPDASCLAPPRVIPLQPYLIRAEASPVLFLCAALSVVGSSRRPQVHAKPSGRRSPTLSLLALAATPKAKRTFVTSALANPNASIVMAPWVACDTSVMSTLGLLTLQQSVKYPLDNPTRWSTLKYMLNQLAPDQVFHALGDSTRRRLVEHLSRGPASVSDLAKPLGITLAAVVQHLQVLERSGVVRTQKVGRVRTCRIEPTGLNVAAEWIADRQSLWERRLDRLGDMLAEEDQTTGRPARERDNT